MPNSAPCVTCPVCGLRGPWRRIDFWQRHGECTDCFNARMVGERAARAEWLSEQAAAREAEGRPIADCGSN